MSLLAPWATLTSAIWNWEVYYVPAIWSAIDWTFATSSYFDGLDSGVVGIAPLNMELIKDAAAVKATVDEMSAKIHDGYNIFTGPIKDNTGKVVIPAGEEATVDEMLSMMYLVEGVIGTIPN